MNTLSVLIFGIIVSLCALLLKELKSNYAILCVLVGGIIILLLSIQQFGEIYRFISALQNEIDLSTKYIEIIAKVFGICILGELTISVCRDCGHSVLVGAIEFMCKCSVMALALPVFEDVLAMLGELLL